MRTLKLLSFLGLVVAALVAASCGDSGSAPAGPAAGATTPSGGVITANPAQAAHPHMLKH